MTAAEAKALVALLKAGWPNARIPPETFRLFAGKLERYDAAVGRAAVERVIEQEAFWPAWATIRQEADRIRHERAERRATERGIEGPAPTREKLREDAARLRAISATIGRDA